MEEEHNIWEVIMKNYRITVNGVAYDVAVEENKPFEQNLLRTFIENRIKWSFFATKISLLKKL